MADGYQNPSLCHDCGGQCCHGYAGIAWPEDVGEPMLERLVRALAGGKWQLDYWEGPLDGQGCNVYFIRPAHKFTQGKLVDPSWGGDCIFVGPAGCSLPFKQRPRSCRMLEPKPGVECLAHGYGKEGGARAWLPHQGVLMEALSQAQEAQNELVGTIEGD